MENKINLLLPLINEYYLFLKNNSIYDERNFDYIFNFLNIFDIPINYINSFKFDENLPINGVYLKDKRQIILNLKKLIIAEKYKIINREILIIEYFILLFHEIIHVLQNIYCDNYNDNKSQILKTSFNLKKEFPQYIHKYHELYPDEVNSNFRSNLLVYSYLLQYKNTSEITIWEEKNLIQNISRSIITNSYIINSQIKYLYKIIINMAYEEKIYDFTQNDCVSFGVTKNDITLKNIIDSYQTQILCFDINNVERRLIK